MATLNQILSVAQNGLGAQRSLVALANLNIANVNTPGYARRVASLATAAVPGLGVVVNDPIAVRNPFVARNLIAAFGRMGFHQGRLDALNQVQSAFNDLDGLGLGTSLDAFQNSLTELSANPGGNAERQAVLDSAKALAASFATARRQTEDASDAAVGQANVLATDISSRLAQVSELNARIKTAAGSGVDVSALVDQRDAAVSELGDLINMQVIPQADGSIRLFTTGGRALVGEEGSATLSVAGPAPPDFEVSVLVQSGESAPAEAIAPVGGQLGGLVSVHNENLRPTIEALDAAAFEFANAFNARHQPGFGADGSTGSEFFAVSATVEGAASNLRLSADVDGQPDKIAASTTAGGVPGANDNLLLLLQVADQPGVVNGESVRESILSTSLGIARAISGAQTSLNVEEATAAQLQAILHSESGVSLDEELIAVSRAQSAFDAAAAVIQTVDELNTTLLNLLA